MGRRDRARAPAHVRPGRAGPCRTRVRHLGAGGGAADPRRHADAALPREPPRRHVPESALRIYGFDEDAQLWVPASGPQAVDAGANTVTASCQPLFRLRGALAPHARAVGGDLREHAAALRRHDCWDRRRVPRGRVGLDVDERSRRACGSTGRRPSSTRCATPTGRRSFGFESFATRELGLTALDDQAGSNRQRTPRSSAPAHRRAARTSRPRCRRRSRSSPRTAATAGCASRSCSPTASPRTTPHSTTQARERGDRDPYRWARSGVNAALLQSIADGHRRHVPPARRPERSCPICTASSPVTSSATTPTPTETA